jgi:tetratricopeptide (TPR) repeat protein
MLVMHADRWMSSTRQSGSANRPLIFRRIYLKDRHIINLAIKARLLADVDQDHMVAAELYRTARQYFEAHDLEESAFVKGVYSCEILSRNEMMQAIKSGRADRARLVLEDGLAESQSQRWPQSYYAHEYAREFLESGAEFQRFLAGWIEAKDTDSWTPFLKFFLARDYVREGRKIEAIALYSDLYKNDRPFFLKADEAALRGGSGGYLAEILYNLVQLLSAMGGSREASQYLDEFHRFFPKDPRVRSARSMSKSLAAQANRELDEGVANATQVVSPEAGFAGGSAVSMGDLAVSAVTADAAAADESADDVSSYGAWKSTVMAVVVTAAIAGLTVAWRVLHSRTANVAR